MMIRRSRILQFCGIHGHKNRLSAFQEECDLHRKGKASNKNLRSAQTLMSIMGKSKPIASAWNQGLAGISRPLGDRGLHGVKEKIDYYLVVGHMCFEFSNNSIECQSYTTMEK